MCDRFAALVALSLICSCFCFLPSLALIHLPVHSHFVPFIRLLAHLTCVSVLVCFGPNCSFSVVSMSWHSVAAAPNAKSFYTQSLAHARARTTAEKKNTCFNAYSFRFGSQRAKQFLSSSFFTFISRES